MILSVDVFKMEYILNEIYKSIPKEQFELLDSNVREYIIDNTKVKNSKKNNTVKSSIISTISLSPEFNDNESNPDYFLGGKIRAFRKQTLLDYEQSIKNIADYVLAQPNCIRPPKLYMYFKIGNADHYCASTKIVGLDPSLTNFIEAINSLFNKLYEVVESIDSAEYGYTPLYTSDSPYNTIFNCKAIHFPEPQCIHNWNTTQPIIYTNEFKIYTCSDINQNCVEQALKYCKLQHKVNTFEKLCTLPNVCILTPQDYIDNVFSIQNITDLKIHVNSPIKTFLIDDTDTNYFLIYKNHIGVIYDFKLNTRMKNYTEYKPMKRKVQKNKVTVCFDIECYFDPDNNQTHIPYLCSFCYIVDDRISEVISFTSRKCIVLMLEHIITKNYKEVELVAHNGGAYDFHYLISSLFNPTTVKNILIRNNVFIGFDFKIGKTKFSVKDSYSFLLCSLQNAAKAYLGSALEKTEFPHHIVKTEKDLYYSIQKWKNVNFSLETDKDRNKLTISSRETIIYDDTDGEARTLLEWAEEYCENDVIVLANVWKAFKAAVDEIFDCNVVDQCKTLAGMSFKLFEAHLPTNTKLYHPTSEDYTNIRSALVGGRCVSENGIYSHISCLDVKSLYPAAMAHYPQPHGQYYRTTTRVPNKLGVYFVEVEVNNSRLINGFFPLFGHKGQIVYSTKNASKKYQAWYTTVDIDIGIEEGHTINYISFDDNNNIGYFWQHQDYIFTDYIENVLYKYKLKYEQEHNNVKRTVIKIIMNSLWGKFAQRLNEKQYSIEYESKAAWEKHDCYKIWETDTVLVKKHAPVDYGNKPVQNGVFTLSWARHHMRRLWNACVINPNNTVCLYSDTDSMFVDSKYIDYNATFQFGNKEIPVIGDGIGQLEEECKFEWLICTGKKQYMGFWWYSVEGILKKGEKKRFKGIPQKYIIPELYTHLLKSSDNIAQVNFMKFRKNWGSVSARIEHKIVKAT